MSMTVLMFARLREWVSISLSLSSAGSGASPERPAFVHASVRKRSECPDEAGARSYPFFAGFPAR
ncbi:hypothetical protein PCE31107_02493 [Pandoraea cepalis]|uniref:Uncharacterized protein n=1 Tax=Pandoraea cepalis TaxID=2508294 RepID=A0A5E4V6P8_9BURK|nr:hypothetical protein PCE31107_02493 [Pandoraea cepalis]